MIQCRKSQSHLLTMWRIPFRKIVTLKGIQVDGQKFQGGDILNVILGHKYHQAHLNLANEVKKFNKKRLF